MHMIKFQKLLPAFILLLLFSCKTDVTPEPTIEETFDIPKGVKEALAFEYMIHDVEGIVFNMFYSLHTRDQGVISTHADFNIFSQRGNCAFQNLNPDTNQLILNFGTGCTDDLERLRKGAIEIAYTDPNDQIGNIMTITLSDYFYSTLGLDGQITIENISQTNNEDARTYSISFSNLQLTINTETSTFTGARNIDYEKIDGAQFENTQADYRTINNFSYETQGGESYELATTSTAINSFACWLNKYYLPRSGEQTITSANADIEIDFGNGFCDYNLLIKTGNEESRDFDLAAIL